MVGEFLFVVCGDWCGVCVVWVVFYGVGEERFRDERYGIRVVRGVGGDCGDDICVDIECDICIFCVLCVWVVDVVEEFFFGVYRVVRDVR